MQSEQEITNDRYDLVETLEFLKEMGADDVVLSDALDKTLFKAQDFDCKKYVTADFHKPEVVPQKPIPKRATKAQSLQQTSQALANQAKTLDDLREMIEGFDECPLKVTASNTVFADGNPQADVMLIGEAPGADEDRLGKPFVGLSGQLLDRMFSTIGLDRQSLYITNIVPWRPPGNRPPTNAESALCLPFVRKHIELINPKYLIFIGGTSAKALLNTNEGIMKMRGKWLDYKISEEKSIKAMAMFHPAFLLRSPGQKRFAWYDLLKIKVALGQ